MDVLKGIKRKIKAKDDYRFFVEYSIVGILAHSWCILGHLYISETFSSLERFLILWLGALPLVAAVILFRRVFIKVRLPQKILITTLTIGSFIPYFYNAILMF